MTYKYQGLSMGVVNFAAPTLLLVGESSSFDWLADRIAERLPLTLESVSSKGISGLIFVPTERGQLAQSGAVLEWRISESEAKLTVLQLRELAASSSPAHIYLDPASNLSGLQLMASKGEYDPARVFAEPER